MESLVVRVDAVETKNRELETKNGELETKNQELEKKVQTYEMKSNKRSDMATERLDKVSATIDTLATNSVASKIMSVDNVGKMDALESKLEAFETKGKDQFRELKQDIDALKT